MEAYFVLILLTLYSPSILEANSSRWIIWNVGQGEWVTHVLEDRCLHFDMGGEHWPKKTIGKTCGHKKNFAYFSHWDLDHVGFVSKARSVLPNFCLGRAPVGETSRHKKWLIRDLQACDENPDLKTWVPPLPRNGKKSSNERSQIYIGGKKMLVTGDAPAAAENLFVQASKDLKNIRWLVLGHHGSRTSTSENLLRALPSLRLAIASARHGKYGHPHSEILRRLRYYQIPVLSTEDWGHIEIRDW